MARVKTVQNTRTRRKADAVYMPFFYAWQKAIGMPTWRVMAATDLSDATLYNAETGRPISKATARLLAVALEVPLELLLRVRPDHEDAREIVRLRAAQVQEELAAYDATLEVRRLAFLQTSLPTQAAA
jgi:hypothetical protein